MYTAKFNNITFCYAYFIYYLYIYIYICRYRNILFIADGFFFHIFILVHYIQYSLNNVVIFSRWHDSRHNSSYIVAITYFVIQVHIVTAAAAAAAAGSRVYRFPVSGLWYHRPYVYCIRSCI